MHSLGCIGQLGVWGIFGKGLVFAPGIRPHPKLPHQLAPIVVAAALRGKRGETVSARCDNAAVVSIVSCGTSENPEVMQLMRS